MHIHAFSDAEGKPSTIPSSGTRSTALKTARKDKRDSLPLSTTYTVEIGGARKSGQMGFLTQLDGGERFQLITEDGLTVVQDGYVQLTAQALSDGVPFLFGETEVRIRTRVHLDRLLIRHKSSPRTVVHEDKLAGRSGRKINELPASPTIITRDKSSSSSGLTPTPAQPNKKDQSVRFKYFKNWYRRQTAALVQKTLSMKEGILQVDMKNRTFTIHTQIDDYTEKIKDITPYPMICSEWGSLSSWTVGIWSLWKKSTNRP
jgi:hypothetical protein